MDLQSMFFNNQFYIEITFLEFFIVVQNFLPIVIQHTTCFASRALN